jgi:Domain of unknown function (DUF4381)
MNADPGSLENLHDLVMPVPVPWWPPPLGWVVVSAALIMLLGWWLIRAIRHWQSNSYRREALVLLEKIDRSGAELPILIKRVALSAYPRERVASLTGEQWQAFLDQTGHTDAFTKGAGRRLARLAYEPQQAASLSTTELNGLRTAVRDWILRHRPEETPS